MLHRLKFLTLMLMATMLTALPPCAFADTPGPADGAPAPGLDDVTVSIVVFDPGSVIYELEGHAALRVRTPSTDVIYNWGTFDFAAPNFVYRFVKGETDYSMAAAPTAPYLAYYASQGRVTTEQVLDLTPAQKEALLKALRAGMLPQNRVYRYNYVKDNCSTRIIRVLREAAAAGGDSIVLAPAPTGLVGTQPTFRSVMRRYHANYPWYQFGIDLALGSGIDKPLEGEQAAFAPVVMRPMAEGATIGGRPLVSASGVILPGEDVTAGSTPWYLTPMAAATVVFMLAVLLSVRDWKRRRVSRWFDAALFGLFGLAGCLIAFLVFVSSHEATSPNVLILWLNPLCLLVPALIWVRRACGILRAYMALNTLAVAAMLVAAAYSGQHLNGAFYPLIAADIVRSLSYFFLAPCKKESYRH